jgi:hypothetical protein
MLQYRSGVDPRSIFSEPFFTRRDPLAVSPFIRAMHPKTEIRPLPDSIQRTLALGWVAQLKIHGHRAQVHIPESLEKPILVYNRHGKLHRKALSPAIISELRRLFQPSEGWNVIDAEWIKPEDKLFVFDFLRKDGKVLRALTFPERWKKLPRLYLSPHLSTLPLIKDLAGCMKALQSKSESVEGLVFKSATSPGFSDTSIVRCRKK